MTGITEPSYISMHQPSYVVETPSQQKDEAAPEGESLISPDILSGYRGAAGIQRDPHTVQKIQLISLLCQDLQVVETEKSHATKLREHVRGLQVKKPEEALASLEPIGSGQFKTVFKIFLVANGIFKPVVASSMQFSQEDPRSIAARNIRNEKEMALMTAKKSIIGVLPNYGVLVHPETGDFVVVTKFCNKGSMNNSFTEVCKDDPKKTLEVVKNCWEALKHLHEAGFTHCDVKASNFLLHETKEKETKCYISDTGLAFPSHAANRETVAFNQGILPPFARSMHSPEARGSAVAHPKADTWAFGLMICNLLRMSHPDLAFDCDEQELSRVSDKLSWLFEKNPQVREDNVKHFIDTTFEKAPFTSDKKLNEELKSLVTQMMGNSFDTILDDETVSKKLEEIFKNLS